MLPMMLRSVEMMSSVGMLQRPAVADDEARPARSGHGEGVVLGALLGDEVEDDVAPPPPVSWATASTWDPSATTVSSAPSRFASSRASGLASTTTIRVGRQRRQALDADVAETARAEHDARRTGRQQRDRLADRVVGGDAGVGERRDVLRLRAGSSFTHARAEVSR